MSTETIKQPDFEQILAHILTDIIIKKGFFLDDFSQEIPTENITCKEEPCRIERVSVLSFVLCLNKIKSPALFIKQKFFEAMDVYKIEVTKATMMALNQKQVALYDEFDVLLENNFAKENGICEATK